VPFDLKGLPIISTFIGRSADINKLDEIFTPQVESNKSKERRVLFLAGLGGMGKTQLALKYAKMNQANYDSIFWCDGRSEKTLIQSIADIARKLPEGQIPELYRSSLTNSTADINAKEIMKHVLDWFSLPENVNWLLIIDNVDKDFWSMPRDVDSFDVRDFFPTADQGSIIVTTRLQHLGEGLEIHELLALGEDDSFNLLQKRAHKNMSSK
jgi:hypothetical protein